MELMATETFTWKAVDTPQGTITFRRLAAQFGDGYRQVAGDGLNGRVQSWPLQFVGDEAEMSSLTGFLNRHAGLRSFFWTPPLGEQGYYEVAGYSASPLGGSLYLVNATFQQVFKP
ncbi:Phage minor tail protein [plant metagenome]|uniref:Phage minor tail protein n=2 Tax=plant metagenome TaxID=1297885 RepID=A0A484U0D1_9ZZZZ